MELNPTSNLTRVAMTAEKPSGPHAPACAPPAVSFAEARALDQSLAQMPDVRKNAVDQAKALLAQTGYPSPEVLNNVAHLLASNLQD